ncbi:hypothetical protein Thiowin_00117 [Thiorhodovibrio winogradskyi]|uniref:Uncharacterized protein n=1 Tax=Thiorhodovibrio winogradskyi TaxID=77007 RepID=A0ABZ0S3W5_9GAMM
MTKPDQVPRIVLDTNVLYGGLRIKGAELKVPGSI